MKRILFAFGAMLLLISSACAPATPTADPAQIQASAVAAASTMIAMTQAAIPTSTEVPPTPLPSPTPLPIPTAFGLPTFSLIPTVSPTSSTSGDPCGPNAPYKPLDPGAKGPNAKKVVIQNMSKGDVVLSLYLNKTEFGECGGRSFNIGPMASITLYDLKAGCYVGYAYVTGNNITHKESGNFCVTKFLDKLKVQVGGGSVKALPQ